MAGHIITLYFKEQGYDVIGFTRRPISFCKNIIGDAMNPNDVKAVILSDDYDVVINAIGVLNQNAEDHKSMAVMLNGYLPHFIADTLRDSKTKLIHMSTDCVFAGNTGPYYEDSFPDGKIFYDRFDNCNNQVNCSFNYHRQIINDTLYKCNYQIKCCLYNLRQIVHKPLNKRYYKLKCGIYNEW